MSILSVARDVCAVVGINPLPTSIFSGIAGNRTMQEMLALANEMAQRIAYDTREWTALKSFASLAGDGTTTAFPLPANYKRMLLTSNVWLSNSTSVPARFIPDTDEWLQRRVRDIHEGCGEWTIMSNAVHLFPIMGVGVQATYGYLDKNCIVLRSPTGDINGYSDHFLNDTDTYLLDERVLKLGMTWEWKSRHGSAYAEDMGTYTDALMNVMGKDGPAPILIGRLPVSGPVTGSQYGSNW